MGDFIVGFFVGFFTAFVFTMALVSSVARDQVERGFMTHENRLYSIVPTEPVREDGQ